MSDADRLLFRVPYEHRPPTLGEVLARAWPESDEEEREAALTEGNVRVDERPVHDLAIEPGADAVVLAEVTPEDGDYGMPETRALARGDDWIVADKPVGMPGTPRPDDPMDPTAFLADSLGLDRSTFTPAWPMPTTAGGPWLFGLTDSAADRLRTLWTDGELMTTWVALAPRPKIAQGTLYTVDGLRIRYSATTMRNGLCEMQLTPEWTEDSPPDDLGLADALLEALADEGIPALGDRRRGGYMVPGGLRLRLAALFKADSDLQHSWSPPDDWWPADPVLPPDRETDVSEEVPESIADLDLPTLTITTDALDRLLGPASPWVRTEEVAGRIAIEPGTLVRLQGTNDVFGPIALTDSRPDVAARIWSDDPLDAVYPGETVDIRLDEALARRAPFMREVADNDLFRLVHGEADGLPGLTVDRIGPVLRAELRGATAFPFKERVYDLLVEFDEQAMVLELERAHDRQTVDARVARSGARYVGRDRDVIVREHGVRFLCNPWEPDLPVDPAHRPTRRRLLEEADSGDRWLILADPATASPVTLATCGIAGVVFPSDGDSTTGVPESVVLNGYDTDALMARRPPDAFDALETDPGTYDGLVCDLAFCADHARRDRDEVLAACLSALAPSGFGIVFAPPTSLETPLPELVERAAESAEVPITEPAGYRPPEDYPSKEHFPEGTPFVAVAVRVG